MAERVNYDNLISCLSTVSDSFIPLIRHRILTLNFVNNRENLSHVVRCFYRFLNENTSNFSNATVWHNFNLTGVSFEGIINNQFTQTNRITLPEMQTLLTSLYHYMYFHDGPVRDLAIQNLAHALDFEEFSISNKFDPTAEAPQREQENSSFQLKFSLTPKHGKLYGYGLLKDSLDTELNNPHTPLKESLYDALLFNLLNMNDDENQSDTMDDFRHYKDLYATSINRTHKNIFKEFISTSSQLNNLLGLNVLHLSRNITRSIIQNEFC